MQVAQRSTYKSERIIKRQSNFTKELSSNSTMLSAWESALNLMKLIKPNKALQQRRTSRAAELPVVEDALRQANIGLKSEAHYASGVLK